MMAALQAQHAHFVEQQKGLEARMRLQEQQYLQATAPTRVEIIREQVIGPSTPSHPPIAQPQNDIPAQLGQVVVDLHWSLSDHASRQAGDMRESMKQWLQDAHNVWNRPPPTPPQHVVAYTPGQPSSSGLQPSTQNMSQRAARSAEVHTAHESTGRRERSRSPQPAGESADAAAAVVRQRTTPARVTKPKAISAPKPKKYGPTVGAETPAPAPPPPPPPERKRKEQESEARPTRPRAIAKAKATPRAPAPAAPAPAPPAKKKRSAVIQDAPRRPKRPREPEAEPEAEPEGPPRKRKGPFRPRARGRRIAVEPM